MSLSAHPYWLSIPTMVMGYLNGSNKYLGNPIDKSTVYSFLGTSTFLWTWRNISIITNEATIPKPKPSPLIIGSLVGGALISGSIYCMGHLIGVAANKPKNTSFKNLIENKSLQ